MDAPRRSLGGLAESRPAQAGMGAGSVSGDAGDQVTVDSEASDSCHSLSAATELLEAEPC